jgi:hypothetical protein
MSEKKHNFHKLTPSNQVDLKIYKDALKFVFDNNDIKNIAISGPYSAGKSSVLETYKKVHTNYKFIHISLAHFEVTEPNSIDYEKSIAANLEGKILNQLIHQIEPDEIPQTNFKVKQKVSKGRIIQSTGIISALLVLASYIVQFNKWCQYISTLQVGWVKLLLLWTTNSVWPLVSGISCLAILGYIIYSIIETQRNKNIFRKVSLQGNEIEIFEEQDNSYFDKYLNEVLYLFENSHADAIVFEDMDRYNVNQIFEKLREINTLINNKKKIEMNNPIRFFYLIRDDIFISKDRTKFFDFIIPVIPVIDSSNSYDQFIEHFKEGGILDKFDLNFLQGLSLYVDDMRILKNIYNEFIIYFNRISITELNVNKLLAIIAYKNIFPKDFGDLHIGAGFVNTLFENKSRFIEEDIKKINEKINILEKNIKSINNEMLNSIDELDSLFFLCNLQISSVNGISASAFKTHVELVKAIKENPQNVGYYSNHSTYTKDMTNELKQQLIENPEYLKRKELIERKNSDQVDKWNSEIQTLQGHKKLIQGNRLREVITKDNINSIFEINYTNEIGEVNKFEEIKGSQYFPLIKYLIRNGYIDESYPDYMTYFYENTLSRIDKIFLRSVTDQIPKAYTYSLKDPKQVLSRLRIIDFEHVEVLNNDLLCYILETEQNNFSYLNHILYQLKNTNNFSFISQFLETRRACGTFIKSLNRVWIDICENIIFESSFSDSQKKNYIIDTFIFSSDEEIRVLNSKGGLSKYISEAPDFLEIDLPDIDKIINGFKLLNVQFEWLDFGKSDKDLFYSVYENNLYQLSFKLITFMLEVIYNIPKSNDYIHRNFTLVSSKPNEPLMLNIKKNINQYINIILDNCEKSIEDDERVALSIINNPEIKKINKESYIVYLQTKIRDIHDVLNKDFWEILLVRKRILYTADNILNYYFFCEVGPDSSLIQFINSENRNLNFNCDEINIRFGEGAADKFIKSIINCNELSNERYEMILKSMDIVYNTFSYTELKGDKVLILIKLGVIHMTSDNLIFMRENYPYHLVPFILKNISVYNNKITNEDNFDYDEMLLILDQNIPDGYKIRLLEHTSHKVSIQNKKYSSTVRKHILEHNFDTDDIPYLLEIYIQESKGIKEKIKQIIVEYIDAVINEEYFVPFELLTELLSLKDISHEIKKRIFTLCLPKMDKILVMKYLRILQMENFLSLFDRKNPKIEVNDLNKRILDNLKIRNWINTFDYDKDDTTYYRAYGRKLI